MLIWTAKSGSKDAKMTYKNWEEDIWKRDEKGRDVSMGGT